MLTMLPMFGAYFAAGDLGGFPLPESTAIALPLLYLALLAGVLIVNCVLI